MPRSRAIATAPIEVRLTPQSQLELRRITSKMRKHGSSKAIKRALSRNLRTAAKPVEKKAKNAALSLPVKGQRSSQRRESLRKQTARAVGTEVRTGGRDPNVRIVVRKNKMDPDRKNLPRYMNTGRWRHPVFGGDIWVEQQSPRIGWFDKTVKPEAPTVRKGVERVLDDIEKRVR